MPNKYIESKNEAVRLVYESFCRCNVMSAQMANDLATISVEIVQNNGFFQYKECLPKSKFIPQRFRAPNPATSPELYFDGEA